MTDDIHVLYVEDDPALRDLAAELLERAGPRLSVGTVADPTTVLDCLRARSVDCLVSDYEMPAVDGLELCDRVRREYPDIPFFLFTSSDDPAVIEAALDVGATDYIRKARGTEHYTLLANRIANAVEHYRDRNRLADLMSQP